MDARSAPKGHNLGGVLRWLLLAGYVGAVYAVVIAGLGRLLWPAGNAAVALSFVAAAVTAVSARPVLRGIDRLVRRTVLHQAVTPYRALVAFAASQPATGAEERALPALARVLGEAVGARHASVWLRADGVLRRAAAWPADSVGEFGVADLAELRGLPDIDHAVPIPAAGTRSGALAIGKSGPGSVTAQDERLLRDGATSAGLLLRTGARNAELHEKLRQAEKLELELRSSRERLLRARDVERGRVVTEITAVTNESLVAIAADLRRLAAAIDTEPTSAERVLRRLRRALDELIESFRAVVHGVYPGVLRDAGPRPALEEMAGDLPRPIRITGEFGHRVDWELESGVYYAAAAAMRLLGRSRSAHPLRVHLGQDGGRLSVRVDDPDPAAADAASLRAALANDSDRLAALGGGLDLTESARRISMLAWLPDGLAPDVTPPADEPEPDWPTVNPEVAGPLLARVRELLDAAIEDYADQPAGATLLEIAARLAEPLRVALLGRISSGKSTLLNALVGEELAAERTRLPVWYRYGTSCRITLYPVEGPPRLLEFGPRGAIDLGGLTPRAVDRIVVDWPADVLRGLTLIDFPGLDAPVSAGRRTQPLAARAGAMPIADAAIYLFGRLEPADIRLLGELSGQGSPVSVIGVVSRADELAGGGPQALAEARLVAGRLCVNRELRGLCQAVAPVAGLLATSGFSVRDNEFRALRDLADRNPSAQTRPSGEQADLVARLGGFGVRLAVELIRDGLVATRAELVEALVGRSGLTGLREVLVHRLVARADLLKARSALRAVDTMLTGLPASDPHREALRYALEQLRAGAHELVELDLLDRLRANPIQLSEQDISELARLLGDQGPDPRRRLGLAADATDDTVRAAAVDQLARWQRLAANPVAPREVREFCLAAVRTCEGLMS
jgi:signal transduction histidine kinase